MKNVPGPLNRYSIVHFALWVAVPCVVLLFIQVPLGRAKESQPEAGSGTVTTQSVSHIPKIEDIAVLPFKASSDEARTGIAFLLGKKLQDLGRFQVFTDQAITGKTKLAARTLAALNEQQALEVGNLMGVDAVVFGTVYKYKAANRGKKQPPEFLFSAKMIHCETGKLLWSARNKKRAHSVDRELEDIIRQQVAALAKSIDSKLPGVPRSGEAEETTTVSDDSQSENKEAGWSSATEHGFRVEDEGLREITLAWDKPGPEVYRFRIERAPSRYGPFTPLANVSPRRLYYRDHHSRSFSMEDETAYYYRMVTIRRNRSEGEPSEPVRGITAPSPSSPAGLKASANASRSVVLIWNPSDSKGVVEYRIERVEAEDGEDFLEIARTGLNKFIDSGSNGVPLGDSTRYLYRVSSINRVGSIGEPSVVVSVMTRPPPAPVSDLNAGDREVRSVVLEWSPSKEEDVVEYHVFRSGSENGEFLLLWVVGGRTNARYVDGGSVPGNLPDNKTFHYMIKAFNAVGAQSAASRVISVTTRRKPPKVVNLEARSGEPRQAFLQWEESSDERVRGYEVWRAVGRNGNYVYIGKTTSRESTHYLDRGRTKRKDGLGLLLDGTAYHYRILAFNTAKVMSDWSASVSAMTKEAPEVPTGLLATTDKPMEITLQWNSNKEVNIQHYLLEITSGPASLFPRFEKVQQEPGSSLAFFNDDDVRHGRERYYRVKAMDDDGLESEWTSPVQGQAKPLPGQPRNVDARYTERHVTLTWDAPPQQDIQEYRVWKKSFLKSKMVDSTDRNHYRMSLADLDRRTAYSITAVDRDGLESTLSTTVTVDTNNQR